MFLKKIELRGFKSFASKTTVSFPTQHQGHVITGIVGPNGSGKSNIADAIRWVLGEQSIKMLRGKKSQDVIFAGTDKKAKLSSAEVLLYLDNSDGLAPVDMSEIVIGRRLFRNGDSEYLINNQISKLQEVNLLLARAHFGHRTYSIIGQGMVDSFVTAGALERQELLEEATGVKEFQLKKQDAINKLSSSLRNLEQVGVLLIEIQPRLRSLTRQVKKLERKEQLAQELKRLHIDYYGQRYQAWQKELSALNHKQQQLSDAWQKIKKETDSLQNTWQKVALSDSVSSAFQKLQIDYETLLNKKNNLFQEELKIKNEIILAQSITQKSSNPWLNPRLTETVMIYIKNSREIIKQVLQTKTIEQLQALIKDLTGLQNTATELNNELTIGKNKPVGTDKKLTGRLADIVATQQQLTASLKANQAKINDLKKEEQYKNKKIIDIQQQLQKQQSLLADAGGNLNEQKITKARLEAKIEDLVTEIKQEQLSLEEINKHRALTDLDEEPIRQEIIKLKHQLELIGGIDNETMAEYSDTKKRFEFLSQEINDARTAIKSLDKIIGELEQKIQHQFNASFTNINKLFIKYFQILFSGGKAHLKKLPAPKEIDLPLDGSGITASNENQTLESDPTLDKTLNKYTKNKLSGGIEIQATPPGKKLTSVNMLSGGEKALTAIALICAIIANRPSPFVVLDEVDAALDEANSERYAKILADLSSKTQFIVITHNRATMHEAKVLYGISMGKDGVSQMLSVELEEIERGINNKA